LAFLTKAPYLIERFPPPLPGGTHYRPWRSSNHHPISGNMNLELSDEKAAALERELTAIIDGERYFLSPRIQTLREIRDMIRLEPVREPLPEPKRYEPPRGGRYRRRG
jgi:hypothetical protein